MGKPKKPYHHGDLRSALLRAAVELIAEHGLRRLSLREAARRAGVSHGAPGRHFADKNALIAAIAEEGFAELARRGEAAMLTGGGAREQLDAYGVAYVRFAFECPVHFRVMFTSELEPERHDGEHGKRAFELLREAARRVTGESGEALTGAVAAWSLSHGLAMLILDGRVPRAQVPTAGAAEALALSVFANWRGALAR